MKVVSYIAQWRGIVKEAMNRTAIAVKFLCCLHITDNYFCSPVHIYGPSMLPTLNMVGDIVLAEHLSQRLGKVRHGDLVVVRSPSDPKKSITKRIMGMEGDTVTYFDPMLGDATRVAVVPKGHVWIQGDNIFASLDSRHFGPVPYGLIQGKVFFRVWPLDCIGVPGQ
ncbi:hypothetical protein PIB30_000119 [Stylosanthes scabra]|uniref:Peptidase S26 domain-containing protein n=1 Tax=Stylosanthes scabra TaxID=79078 RepID=A0ABU6R3G3_9FABA|nr:hypothetical protein [Stylosanthes scabra]